MPTMTIEVQGVEQPKPNRTRGRIKDTSGMVFQAKPVILKSVSMGSKYEVEYKDEEWTPEDGGVTQKYRVIYEVKPVGSDSLTSVVPAAPQRRDMPPLPLGDTKTEDISALAIIKSMQIDPEASAVFSALKEAALGWRRFKKWQQSVASDMNDDKIPY
jgi:hypothetical protein